MILIEDWLTGFVIASLLLIPGGAWGQTLDSDDIEQLDEVEVTAARIAPLVRSLPIPLPELSTAVPLPPDAYWKRGAPLAGRMLDPHVIGVCRSPFIQCHGQRRIIKRAARAAELEGRLDEISQAQPVIAAEEIHQRPNIQPSPQTVHQMPQFPLGAGGWRRLHRVGDGGTPHRGRRLAERGGQLPEIVAGLRFHLPAHLRSSGRSGVNETDRLRTRAARDDDHLHRDRDSGTGTAGKRQYEGQDGEPKPPPLQGYPIHAQRGTKKEQLRQAHAWLSCREPDPTGPVNGEWSRGDSNP